MEAMRSHFAQTTATPILFNVPDDIRPITAEQTRPLRHAVLRPHQRAHELIYDGDGAPDTLHVGAFREGKLVGIASVYREPPPGEDDPSAWRLRGMAVTPALQRTGIGRKLLAASVAHAKANGGTRLWFNARRSAVGFYEKLGYQVQGEEFELHGIGPHIVMWRNL